MPGSTRHAPKQRQIGGEADVAEEDSIEREQGRTRTLAQEHERTDNACKVGVEQRGRFDDEDTRNWSLDGLEAAGKS